MDVLKMVLMVLVTLGGFGFLLWCGGFGLVALTIAGCVISARISYKKQNK